MESRSRSQVWERKGSMLRDKESKLGEMGLEEMKGLDSMEEMEVGGVVSSAEGGGEGSWCRNVVKR